MIKTRENTSGNIKKKRNKEGKERQKNNSNKNHAFCDFDDTITKNSCLLFSKYKFLTQKLNYPHKKAYLILKSHLTLNPIFFDILNREHINSITILSYNNQQLLEQVVLDFQEIFSQNNITIKGIYGGTHKTKKKEYLKNNTIYIADIFEQKFFSQYPNFICIDGQYSIVKYCWIFIRKVIYYSLFRIGFFIMRKRKNVN